MSCEFWGECGGCSLPLSYEDQLKQKIESFETLNIGRATEIFESPKEGFRSRAEFKIFRDDSGLHLAMFAGKKPVVIVNCPILLPHLQEKLQELMSYLRNHLDFAHKLFSLEVMGGVEGGCLLTLIYHRRLDALWEEEARALAQSLGIQLIGRSRGQKIILGGEGLEDRVCVDGQDYRFLRYDNGFSQPNPYMNVKMLGFALSCVREREARDLLELYCGGGNFTIPLSRAFNQVFATELAKSSIKALNHNLDLNRVENVSCVRLSGKESIEALSEVREFRRLKGINLADYEFSHLLVDPPRSGIGDREMLNFMRRFPNILYISCNPLTLKKDLEILEQTHSIQRLALFDQFPYTHHLECGVWLEGKEA